MKLGFKKAHPDAVLPKYAHVGDAGMDVYAVEDVELKPGKATLVSTGLVADIPEGFEIQVRPRSGLALKGNITVWNSPGTVDSNYRGVIGVIMMWLPPLDLLFVTGLNIFSSERIKIHKGDRIAQLVVAPVTQCEPFEVSEVSETDRGEGGFGSTGK
jgi:dUTP pyrophosphatase